MIVPAPWSGLSWELTRNWWFINDVTILILRICVSYCEEKSFSWILWFGPAPLSSLISWELRNWRFVDGIINLLYLHTVLASLIIKRCYFEQKRAGITYFCFFLAWREHESVIDILGRRHNNRFNINRFSWCC